MKARWGWVFESPKGERWIGDCPAGVASLRKDRPDMTARRIKIYGNKKWSCPVCESGGIH